MRRAFIATLVELAASDPRIVLLTGDLGFHSIEPFSDRFPDRFFNAGVAEQNMVGMATGLAEAGLVPFVYSIVPFAVLRPYEFIRNGPIHHQLPVRIVGIGGGFEYGHLGASHYGLEDVGVLRMQPGMTVIAPADHQQAAAALRATWNLPGPSYYRVGKDDQSVVEGLDGRFTFGAVDEIGSGADALVVAMGSIAVDSVRVRKLLREQGIDTTFAVVSTIAEAGAESFAALLARHRTVVTVEAHYAAGGLGAWAAEIAADRQIAIRLIRCAVRHPDYGHSGSQSHLHSLHGISSDAVAQAVVAAIARAR